MPPGVPVLQVLIAILCSGGLSAGVDFNRDIRPILSDHCFACHGPDEHERKGKLRLDTSEGARKGGETESTIVPGNPDESELIHRIFSSDPDEVMPPPKAQKDLRNAQKALLRQWVAEGGKYAEPWTYLPPKKHPIPAAQSPDRSENWIDSFILDRLRSEGLQPAPDADPVTLVRRLHFDLIGLPPTPAEVSQFVKNWQQDPASCLETTADTLLSSPHFGERMAMYLSLIHI